MRFFIDGREIPGAALGRQEMNFGQPWQEPSETLCYAVVADRDEFIQRFQPAYEQSAREEQEDIPFHERGEFLHLDRWQDHGYPPLERLYAADPELVSELARWFAVDALDSLLPNSSPGIPSYVINTLDRVNVQENEVRLEGRAYRCRVDPVAASHPVDAKQLKELGLS